MKTVIQSKRRMNGQWMNVPFQLLKGMSLHEAVNTFDNTETVVRINRAGDILYACGKEDLCQLYQKRGDRTCLLKDLPSGDIPDYEAKDLSEIFPDALLDEVVVM